MIRNARHSDVLRMIELGRAMHAESKYRCYDFDPLKLANTISELIEVDRGIAIVAEVQGRVVGALIGYLAEHYFGNDLAAYVLALFIPPEHRNGMVGPQLIRQYIERARNKGASEIVLANTTGYEKERVGRLIERLGFRHDGYVFSMQGGRISSGLAPDSEPWRRNAVADHVD